MSIISTPSTVQGEVSEDRTEVEERTAGKKVLEEDEYLDRMAKIIRRDFFPGTEVPNEESTSHHTDVRSEQRFTDTPGTYRSQLSTTSSARSRQEACHLGLNEYLERYTSEDNAYFEKLQGKELRRHRMKYPWLYDDNTKHTNRVKDQLKLPSAIDQASITNGGSKQVIDWPHNPRNSLFYPPKEEELSRKRPSTVNYNASRLAIEDVFKEPLPGRTSIRPKAINKFSDKIGIDGKLLNGSETPIINGYAFIPPPESPKIVEDSKHKLDTNRFYIPSESPRDELAHRVYQEKVAKNIRTPSRTGTPSSRTPSYRRGITDSFVSFSPERVKNLTPKINKR